VRGEEMERGSGQQGEAPRSDLKKKKHHGEISRGKLKRSLG